VKYLVPAAAIVAAFLVQTLGARYFPPIRTHLDLFAVVTIWMGLVSGRLVGMGTGTAAGLVQDTFSGGILGLNGLSKTAIGYFAGIAGRRLIIRGWAPRFVFFFLASASDLLLLTIVGLAVEQPSVRTGAANPLTLCLGNGFVGTLVLGVADRLRKRK